MLRPYFCRISRLRVLPGRPVLGYSASQHQEAAVQQVFQGERRRRNVLTPFVVNVKIKSTSQRVCPRARHISTSLLVEIYGDISVHERFSAAPPGQAARRATNANGSSFSSRVVLRGLASQFTYVTAAGVIPNLTLQ